MVNGYVLSVEDATFLACVIIDEEEYVFEIEIASLPEEQRKDLCPGHYLLLENGLCNLVYLYWTQEEIDAIQKKAEELLPLLG